MNLCGPEREPSSVRLPLSRTYPGLRVLGLTGPAASGKSFLLALFGQEGACAIEVDAVYADLVQPESALLDRIEAGFPGTVADSRLNRAELARRVFGDPAELGRLNDIVHPPLADALTRTVREQAEGGADRIAIEAAILFEAGMDRICDETWFVACERGERIRRLQVGRDWSLDRATRLVGAQGEMKDEANRCDRIVDGSQAADHLRDLARSWIAAGR